jgi:hypothetical protein
MKANTYVFWAKIWIFLIPIKTQIWDHYVLLIRNMRVTDKKYELLVSFYSKTSDFRQNRRLAYMDFYQKFDFFKPIKTHIYDHHV